MQLYTPDQIPATIQGRVYRQSRFVALAGITVLIAFLAGVPTFFLLTMRPSLWISFPAMSAISLIALWLVGVALKAFRATNWLLRIAPDGLWINLRSYRNDNFAPAATALLVPYAEIVSVGESAIRRSEQSGGKTTVWTDRYLEVRLAAAVPAEVAQQISEERRRTAPKKYLGGLVTSESRYLHVPVSLRSDNVLRLAWRGRCDFIVPSLKNALAALSAECQVEDAPAKDLANTKQLSDDEIDHLIIECVETGDTFGAIKLLRDKRGYSLKQAKDFVDELTVRL